MGRVKFAETLRGLAALCVLVSHYVGAFWLAQPIAAKIGGFPPVVDPTPPLYVTHLNGIPHFEWGPFGVALFFLVSGFVLPFSFNRYTALGFIIGRAFRIYPTYAVGFSITLASLLVSAWWFNGKFGYSWQEVAVHYIVGLRDLLWTPPIDGVIWTLEVEIKFYLICAAAAVLLRRGSLLIFAIPLTIALAVVLSPPVLASLYEREFYSLYKISSTLVGAGPYLVFMFIGVALNFGARSAMTAQRTIAVVFILFGLFAASISFGPAMLGHLIWSYGCALGVFLAASAFPEMFSRGKVWKFFADISYPLYVSHAVLGYVALRLLVGAGINPSVSIVIASTGAVSVAWIIHVFVEQPTHSFGRRSAQRAQDNLTRLARRTPNSVLVEAAPALSTTRCGSTRQLDANCQ
jgi:peptidoglycan/LPS O-acetylase OafA/YrhL